MDRKIADKIIEVGQKDACFKINTESGPKGICFARADQSDVAHYEAMPTDKLIEAWKSLIWIVDIYGQVSVSDIQCLSLMEMEMESRKVDPEPLRKWYVEAEAKWRIEEAKMEADYDKEQEAKKP